MDDFTACDLRKLFLSLVEITSCAICLEKVRLPMVQCVRGHVICEACKNGGTVEQCPTCKDFFTSVKPTFALAQVVEALPARCQHAQCSRYVKPGSNHETYCGFKLIQCKLCECVVAGNSMLKHMQQKHYALVFNLTEGATHLVLENFNPDTTRTDTKFYLVGNQMFWDITTNDSKKKMLTKTFFFVPNINPKREVFVEVTFVSGKSPHIFQTKFSLNVNPDDPNKEQNTVHIPQYMLPQFINEENELAFKVHITLV